MYAEFKTATQIVEAASLEFRIGNLLLASRIVSRYPDTTPREFDDAAHEEFCDDYDAHMEACAENFGYGDIEDDYDPDCEWPCDDYRWEEEFGCDCPRCVSENYGHARREDACAGCKSTGSCYCPEYNVSPAEAAQDSSFDPDNLPF